MVVLFVLGGLVAVTLLCPCHSLALLVCLIRWSLAMNCCGSASRRT
jgi:hypothetical protein